MPVVAAMTITSHASDAMVAIPFWLEMFAVVAASISGVCWLRASTSSTWWARSRSRWSAVWAAVFFARHDAAGGQRLHPQPADGAAAFHCHGSHHLYFPGNRRQTRKTHSPARHHLGRHLRRHWSRQGASLRLCAGGVHHDGLFSPRWAAACCATALWAWFRAFSNVLTFYAIAAIAGSTSYVCLVMSGIMSNVAALVVCVVVTMGLRWLSLRFDIKKPPPKKISRASCTVKVDSTARPFEMQPRGSFRALARWVPC